MTSQPAWSDSGQGDLLELVAMGSPSTGSAEAEWEWFAAGLKALARSDAGVICPNKLRLWCRDQVKPQRVGAFVHRAIARDLIEPSGWEVSDDHKGGNAGKPARTYRWIGGAL